MALALGLLSLIAATLFASPVRADVLRVTPIAAVASAAAESAPERDEDSQLARESGERSPYALPCARVAADPVRTPGAGPDVAIGIPVHVCRAAVSSRIASCKLPPRPLHFAISASRVRARLMVFLN